ncbi:MAG: M48 family metallopeptidase [Desulfohalobiaceae bacterium]
MRWIRQLIEKMKPLRVQVPFTVRVSPRAKYIRLRILDGTGLEVVLPQGYSAARASGVLRANQDWILRHKDQIEHAAALRPDAAHLPEEIHLEASQLFFTVGYTSDSSQDPCWEMPSRDQILIQADPRTQADVCCWLLQDWLKEQGRAVLVPWAYALAREHGLPVARIQVRRQKTRWGSMSSSGTLSLNCQLLFLSAELVRHVLLHELCHIRHPNHGPKFKALLSELSPQRARYEQELRTMRQTAVPWWAKL